MASPYLLDAGPGQDKFSDLYNKYDSAVDEIIDGASLVGDDLILSKYNGTNFIVDLSALAGSGLPPGTVEGQNIRWDNVGLDWVLAQSLITYIDTIDPSNNITTLSPRDGRPFSEAGFVRVEGGDVLLTTQPATGSTFSMIGMNGSLVNIAHHQPGGVSQIEIANSTGNIELSTQLPGSGVVVDALEGIEIKDNTPTVVTDKLYNDGGDLYWNGNQVCVAPCGGGGTPYTIARSSVFAPGTFNVPTPGTEAERIVTLDSNIASGSYTINLPTTGVNTNYRITVKRVDLSPLTHNIAINPGTGTIDSLSGAVNMNFSRNESISLIARPGVIIGTYDWLRDDNYIDPDAIGSGFDYDIIQLNAAASPHTLVWTGVPIYAICDTSGGPHIVNLPAASPAKKRVTIKRRELSWGTGSNNIAIAPNGGDTIEGVATSIPLQNQQAAVTLIYDPSIGNWYQESNYYALSLETEGGPSSILTPVGSPHSLTAFPRGRNRMFLVDTTTGNVTVNMPITSSPGVNNCIFTIKKIASVNTVIINSPDLIDGSPSLLLSGAFEAARLIFSSGQWRRI